MTQDKPQDAQAITPEPQPRSENLLPADASDDSAADDDGRFEIAEEVNLDQQSDALHHIGNLPEDSPADALAGTLGKT